MILWWIRRDLRIGDNLALAAALARDRKVVPVFVLDPRLVNSHKASPGRLAFLYGGLWILGRDLRARSSYLVLRHGDPAVVLERLTRELGADGIVAEEDFSPYARRRDAGVAARVPLRLVGGATIHHPMRS